MALQSTKVVQRPPCRVGSQLKPVTSSLAKLIWFELSETLTKCRETANIGIFVNNLTGKRLPRAGKSGKRVKVLCISEWQLGTTLSCTSLLEFLEDLRRLVVDYFQIVASSRSVLSYVEVGVSSKISRHFVYSSNYSIFHKRRAN